MKKEYIKPSMEAIEIHQSQILCQSANAAVSPFAWQTVLDVEDDQ